MLPWHVVKMPNIPKEPVNQDVFKIMIGFLTAVSKTMSSLKNWNCAVLFKAIECQTPVGV